MKQIIYKSIFQTVKADNKVSAIDANHIDEFSVGKNFVYMVKNQNLLSFSPFLLSALKFSVSPTLFFPP